MFMCCPFLGRKGKHISKISRNLWKISGQSRDNPGPSREKNIYSPFAIAYLPKLYFSELIAKLTDTDTDL